MLNWLKKRLSPVKKDTERWQQLAESIEQFWQENFDAEHDKLVAMRSIYTADDDSLLERIAEMGDYFADVPEEENKAVAIAWRRYELEFKDTKFIVDSTFRRKFLDIHVDWLPLWALKAGVYGSEFFPEDNIESSGGDIDDYFLTSRGKVTVDIDQLVGKGITAEFFLSQVEPIFMAVKPLHIIYEGCIFTKERICTQYYGTGVYMACAMVIGRKSVDITVEPQTQYTGGYTRYAVAMQINRVAA